MENVNKYIGECRNCKHRTEWIVGDVPNFRRLVLENYYPTFMASCECCERESVFDLLWIKVSK
jgi:hypothetical protein